MNNNKTKFFVELIKPSHYYDDGYVIQWRKSWIPSNTLACINALTKDAADRNALGSDAEFVIIAYDEMNIVIPIADIIRRFKNDDKHEIVFFVGVQSNQFPRAMDIIKQFRDENIQVVIGDFLRRKVRTQRRPGMPLENPLVFYPRRAWGTVSGLVPFALCYFKLRSIRRKIKHEPRRCSYTDKALIPVKDTEDILLENESVMAQ